MHRQRDATTGNSAETVAFAVPAVVPWLLDV